MTFPEFDDDIGTDSYRWWYIDAISDDGENALAIIVFVGSVFSPYYAWSRQSGPTQANAHCAINVALYGAVNRWSMTERAANSIERRSHFYRIGPSTVQLNNDELVCHIDEVCVPIPRRIKGEVRIQLKAVNNEAVSIDSNAKHHWQALAPKTRINVLFKDPAIKWSGNAYVDTNYGCEPIESGFSSWNWSRAHLDNDSTVVQYDVIYRNGNKDHKTLLFNQSTCQEIEWLTHYQQLPTARYWRMPRSTRLSPNTLVSNLRTLEDTPFYSRSCFNTLIDDKNALVMHESIDFDRFMKTMGSMFVTF